MRHGKAHRKLERNISHRRALLRHLVTSLIKHERIETTLPKAKELRRFAERMVTLAKRGDLHARRQAAGFILEPPVVQKLFTVLAERFKDRQGGYTRIIRSGIRKGDTAPMGLIEYLGYELPAPQGKADRKSLEEKTKTAEKKAEKKAPKIKKEKVAKPVKPAKSASKAKGKGEVKEKKKGIFSRLKKEKG